MAYEKSESPPDNEALAHEDQEKENPGSVLEQILESEPSPESHAPNEIAPSAKRFGVWVAIYSGEDSQGNPILTLPGERPQEIIANTIMAMDDAKIGDCYAVMFTHGDTASPIVMGKMLNQNIADAAGYQTTNTHIVQKPNELHLRCGESHLLMTSDGEIEIRGKSVVTHSSGLNRIRGASVKIN